MVLKKKHLKIFIYMIAAYFVGLAVILYDFSVSYAASFNNVDPDTFIHWYQAGKKGEGGALSSCDDVDKFLPVVNLTSHTSVSEYTDTFTWFQKINNEGVYSGQAYNLGYDTGGEVVAYPVYCTSETNPQAKYCFGSTSYLGGLSFCLMSKKQFSIDFYSFNFNANDDKSVSHGRVNSSFSESYRIDDNTFYGMNCLGAYHDDVVFGFNAGSMKVFKDGLSAYNYLQNGDTSGLAWQGAAPKYDGDNIYLDNFEMWVHDSNAYSAYYLEFKYTIPEQLRDAASLKLDIAEQYEYCLTAVASLARIPNTYSDSNMIDLLEYPTGFKLYLDDISAIKKFVDKSVLSTDGMAKRRVLGSEGYLDNKSLSLDGVGLDTLCEITNSRLYLTCYVVANNTYGQSVSGSVDFLSGANGIGTYTPNASGEYKYNGDYKSQGHYETKVTLDDSGNQEYTYYYYSTDNSKKEITAKDSHDNTFTSISPPSGGSSGSIINNITMPDHVFVNLSGSGGSDIPDVTIDDDDLTFDSLRDSIKDGYGLIDDTDTAAKGDGLVAMLSDLFGYLPTKFVGLIMLGTSSVVGIAILRMIFKR